MKKTALLNSALSETIASLGHGDMLVIGDAGLPIPAGPRRIDLALTQGVPGFLETLRTVLTEMKVDRALVALETGQVSPPVLAALREALGDVPLEMISHVRLKELSGSARAVVRTGEFTPYANVILVAGVVF